MQVLGTTPLTEARDLYLLDCEARRLAPATRSFYSRKLRLFIRWLHAEDLYNIEDVTPHLIRRYLISIQERGLSSRHQHNLARAIRAFFNYLVRDELIERSPFEKVKMPKMEKKIPETFTQEEIQKVIQACPNQKVKALCFFLLDTGVRASELLAMNVGDVDLETGVAVVHKGKGQKERPIFIGAATRKQLRYYFKVRGRMRADEPLFTTFDGRRLKQDALVKTFDRLQKASGVKTCKAHTFRRTFAVTCLRNGMNVYVLAKLMGHADISVLRHYLALVEDDLKDAHERYGAVDHFDFSFGDERRLKSKNERTQKGREDATSLEPPKATRKPAAGYDVIQPNSDDGGRRRK